MRRGPRQRGRVFVSSTTCWNVGPVLERERRQRDSAGADQAVHVEAARLRVFGACAVAVDLLRRDGQRLQQRAPQRLPARRERAAAAVELRVGALAALVAVPVRGEQVAQILADVAVPAVGEVGRGRLAARVWAAPNPSMPCRSSKASSPSAGWNSASSSFGHHASMIVDRFVVLVAAGLAMLVFVEVSAVPAGCVPAFSSAIAFCELRVARRAEDLLDDRPQLARCGCPRSRLRPSPARAGRCPSSCRRRCRLR